MLRLALLLFGVAIAAAVFVIVREETSRPSVPALVDLARGSVLDDAKTATARSIDGLGFPDWERYGWKAAGGRLDEVEDERTAATVVYRRRDRSITYTIVSGTGNVDDETVTISRQLSTPGGKVEIAQAQTDGVLTLKRKRDGRTILMTGAPPGSGLARTMQRLAVRGASPDPG